MTDKGESVKEVTKAEKPKEEKKPETNQAHEVGTPGHVVRTGPNGMTVPKS